MIFAFFSCLTWVHCLFVFNQPPVFLKCSPDAEAGFGVHSLYAGEEVGDGLSTGILFVGAVFHLFLIVLHLGQRLQVGFVLQAERADDGEGHLLHAQLDRHTLEAALEELVHERSVYDVVHVVT